MAEKEPAPPKQAEKQPQPVQWPPRGPEPDYLGKIDERKEPKR